MCRWGCGGGGGSSSSYFFRVVLFVTLDFDVIETQIFILVKCALIRLYRHVRVIIWRVEILQVRIGEVIVEDDSERPICCNDLQ